MPYIVSAKDVDGATRVSTWKTKEQALKTAADFLRRFGNTYIRVEWYYKKVGQ